MIITINKYQLSKRLDILSQVFAVIQRFDVAFDYLPSGTDAFSFIARRGDVKGQVGAIMDALRNECDLDSVELAKDISLVAVVSDELGKRQLLREKSLTCLITARSRFSW